MRLRFMRVLHHELLILSRSSILKKLKLG
jgi:hypothetical protein